MNVVAQEERGLEATFAQTSLSLNRPRLRWWVYLEGSHRRRMAASTSAHQTAHRATHTEAAWI